MVKKFLEDKKGVVFYEVHNKHTDRKNKSVLHNHFITHLTIPPCNSSYETFVSLVVRKQFRKENTEWNKWRRKAYVL